MQATNAPPTGNAMTLHTASLYPILSTGGVQPDGGLSGTKTGTVHSSKHGDGTFAQTFEEVNGQKTIDKTVTFADGTQRTKELVVTINDDGSKTITKTGKNGKVTTTHEMKVDNGDGTFSLTRDITNAKGETTEITGTITRSHGEVDKSLTCTNPGGLVETLNRQTVKNGAVVTHTTTGTNYLGETIDNESTWTTFV